MISIKLEPGVSLINVSCFIGTIFVFIQQQLLLRGSQYTSTPHHIQRDDTTIHYTDDTQYMIYIHRKVHCIHYIVQPNHSGKIVNKFHTEMLNVMHFLDFEAQLGHCYVLCKLHDYTM